MRCSSRHTKWSWPGRVYLGRAGLIGDQLKRALSSAVLRYTEGFYADAGNKTSLWKGARASCGEAAAAVCLLALDGRVPNERAVHVRSLLGRSMKMLARLVNPR